MALNYVSALIKLILIGLILSLSTIKSVANNSTNSSHRFLNGEVYKTTVTFPAGYAIGDYVEFVGVRPLDFGASGYYNVSISYTKGNLAAGATHLASVSHYNPTLWREVGRVNANGYTNESYAFTIDCNTFRDDPRFRVRVVDLQGDLNTPITINIKVEALSLNGSFIAKNLRGRDLTVNKLLAMSGSWDLYVGNNFTTDGAHVAIKALMNGNVGIGTAYPQEKLSVNGKIRAQEVKVESANWPDYVFEDSYKKPSLYDVEAFINKNKHLPEVPSAKEVDANGVDLGKLGGTLLKKIEELTLYMIELKKDNERLSNELNSLRSRF